MIENVNRLSTKGDFRVEFTKTQKLLSKLPSYIVAKSKQKNPGTE